MFRTLVSALIITCVVVTVGGCITREDRIKAQNARDGGDRPMPGQSSADE